MSRFTHLLLGKDHEKIKDFQGRGLSERDEIVRSGRMSGGHPGATYNFTKRVPQVEERLFFFRDLQKLEIVIHSFEKISSLSTQQYV